MKDFLLRAAVVKLREWLDRSIADAPDHIIAESDDVESIRYRGKLDAYRLMETKMRTLFAGLIDFDE